MMLLFLQSTVPEETTSTAVEVRLSPDQMQAIGEQINGTAIWTSAFLCVVLVALGALVMVTLVSGR